MFRDVKDIDDVKPYVRRALQDDDLQRNVLRAWKAARTVYDELSGERAGSAAVKAVNPNDRVHQEIDSAVSNLSEALLRMSGRRPRTSGGRSWKPFLLTAMTAFVLFNPATGPSTRKWLKDHLVGSAEEFDYAPPSYD